MPKEPKIRVKENLWGNSGVYIGRRKVYDSASFDECLWWLWENGRKEFVKTDYPKIAAKFESYEQKDTNG